MKKYRKLTNSTFPSPTRTMVIRKGGADAARAQAADEGDFN